MRIAIYPGSFNPWHSGHDDILHKATQVFDKVIVGIGKNPDKTKQLSDLEFRHLMIRLGEQYGRRVEVNFFDGLLADYAKRAGASAIVRGLRNSSDLEKEQIQQYWNEDLGISVPTVYFIADRALTHISSSAIRAVEKAKGE